MVATQQGCTTDGQRKDSMYVCSTKLHRVLLDSLQCMQWAMQTRGKEFESCTATRRTNTTTWHLAAFSQLQGLTRTHPDVTQQRAAPPQVPAKSWPKKSHTPHHQAATCHGTMMADTCHKPGPDDTSLHGRTCAQTAGAFTTLHKTRTT